MGSPKEIQEKGNTEVAKKKKRKKGLPCAFMVNFIFRNCVHMQGIWLQF